MITRGSDYSMLTPLKPTDGVRLLPDDGGETIWTALTSPLPRMLYVLVRGKEKSAACV
jgi:hypothetical protein